MSFPKTARVKSFQDLGTLDCLNTIIDYGLYVRALNKGNPLLLDEETHYSPCTYQSCYVCNNTFKPGACIEVSFMYKPHKNWYRKEPVCEACIYALMNPKFFWWRDFSMYGYDGILYDENKNIANVVPMEELLADNLCFRPNGIVDKDGYVESWNRPVINLYKKCIYTNELYRLSDEEIVNLWKNESNNRSYDPYIY